MKKTTYQQAKEELKATAKDAKRYYKNDKPAIRQSINDTIDGLSREYNLSEYQIDLLSNFACTLHP